MKRMELLICGLIGVLLTVPAMAQVTGVAPPAPGAAVEAPQTAEAIEAKIKILKAQEDKDEAQLDEIRSKIAKSPALADLRKAAADADKTYQEKKISDPGIIAAKKASSAASSDLKAAVLKKVKTSDDGAAILKQIGDLEEKQADLSVQAAIAELKLKHKDSRVARALAADGVLKELYGIYLSAAKGAPRDEARKNYYKLKQASLDKLPEAKELAAEIKTCCKWRRENVAPGGRRRSVTLWTLFCWIEYSGKSFPTLHRSDRSNRSVHEHEAMDRDPPRGIGRWAFQKASLPSI